MDIMNKIMPFFFSAAGKSYFYINIIHSGSSAYIQDNNRRNKSTLIETKFSSTTNIVLTDGGL